MHYFIFENDKLILTKVEILPPEIEEIYKSARKNYTIKYCRSDWADDDRDSGMGYDYDNSYTIFREPKRDELVIKNGKLFGFFVGYNPYNSEEPDKKYLLEISGKNEIYESGTSSNFYGDSKEWKLICESEPNPAGFVFLPHVNETDAEHDFVPSDFPSDYIETALSKIRFQDSRGHFDNAFRIILKLNPEGVENPDAVLKSLSEYMPTLVKKDFI